jgi:chromosome partitioning protein
MAQIAAVADRVESLAHEIRLRVLAPAVRKVSPLLSAQQVVLMCALNAGTVQRYFAEAGHPESSGPRSRKQNTISVANGRALARHHRTAFQRPPASQAITIAVANFKGGVCKTTTAMSLAQGLSLRGHRVLAVDLDPQGSLTTLFGILPQTEVPERMTALSVLRGETEDILCAVQQTYWDGVDLVAAAPTLFAAEVAIPNVQGHAAQPKFWDILNRSLRRAREDYDVIVIDTPPALSYLTINALMAADSVIVPIPPTALDFASLAHFWQLFADFSSNPEFIRHGGKSYAFIRVLLSRVDQADVAAPAVRHWIEAAYGEFLLPAEVPKSTVISAMAAAYATVYDIERYEGSKVTYRRAIEAYNTVTALVEASMVSAWQGEPRSRSLETGFPPSATQSRNSM